MLRIKQVRYTDPDAQSLVGEVQAEYTVLYGGPDGTPLEPTVFDAPSGAFYVGYLGDVPVAMGGWRFRPDVQALGRVRAAEVKRMYEPVPAFGHYAWSPSARYYGRRL